MAFLVVPQNNLEPLRAHRMNPNTEPAVTPTAAVPPSPAPTPGPGTSQVISRHQLAAFLSNPAPDGPAASDPQPAAPEPTVPSQTPVEPPADPPPTESPADPAAPVASDLPEELQQAIAEAKANGANAVGSLLKRVGVLTARLRAAEARVTPAEPTPAADPAPSVPPPTAPAEPSDPAWTAAQQLLARAQQDLEFAEANPNGGSFPAANGQTIEVTPQQIAKLRAAAIGDMAKATARLEAHTATLQQNIQAQVEASKAKAFELVPELMDEESAETHEAMQIVREHPELRQNPRAAEFVAELVLARKTRRSVQPRPSPRPQPGVRRATPGPGIPAAAAPAADPSKAVQQAFEQAKQHRDKASFANLLRVQKATTVA